MIKITELELENVKRIKAIRLEPTSNGLTIIGGKNGQGKTSVLDAIAWALGGDKLKPSNAAREGSVVDPNINIKLSNGLVVTRRGKNSALKVIDPAGNKGGQQLLNEFVEQLAINLPKFLQSTNKEKADTLLKIIGVGDQLADLEIQEQRLFNQRTEIGRIADRKKKYADEMISYPEAPKELVSANDLIKKQQEILFRNGDNQKKRENVNYFSALSKRLAIEVDDLSAKLKEKSIEYEKAVKDLETAEKTAEMLNDESTSELEQSIENIDAINVKVRSNYDKAKAEIDAEDFNKQYEELTVQIEKIRTNRTALLDNADLPLPGLSVKDGELIYNGFKWDNMSGSDQLKISTAIVRKLNPECGFVLMDKLEQMDLDTLKEFGQWLEMEGLQVIATRVSTGEECSILIEDGYVKDQPIIKPTAPTWQPGKF